MASIIFGSLIPELFLLVGSLSDDLCPQPELDNAVAVRS